MGEIGFVPFGEWKPDLRFLINDGLVRAYNVIPVYGNYVASPGAFLIGNFTTGFNGQPFGLHTHRATGDGYAAINVSGTPSKVHLYQATEAGVITDRSRAASYNNLNRFYGASFGSNVVMTNYDDEVQFRDGSGASNFANMITSTFAPRARYAFPLRNNLFLANCNLPASYDGLPSGANPTLAAWSKTDDIRQYGSFNADPQIIGAGYQALNFDIGDITGTIAADDNGIIAFSDGFAIVTGPPYTFQVLTSACGTLHGYSLVRGRDGWIYFWGPSGLSRLNVDGRVEVLGLGKFTRAILDNATGFHEAAWQGSAEISGAYDSVNDLIFMAYRSDLDPNGWAQTYITYNVGEDRASYSLSPVVDSAPQVLGFMRSTRQGAQGTTWSPGSAIRFLTTRSDGSCGYYGIGRVVGGSGNSSVLQRGYIQFNTELTTRLLRIRPIYNVTNQLAINNISVTIQSTNKPYGTPTTFGPYAASNADTHGWITTPDTGFFDFHSPSFTLGASGNNEKVVEFEGFEYEIAIGGAYSE